MSLLKPWRNSASLIVFTKHLTGSNTDQRATFEMLFQKRSKTASSFANNLVFPGGVTEKSDSSEIWIQYIKGFGFSQVHFDTLWTAKSKVPPIFSDDPLKSHISLRITAIREAFEELGILLCRRDKVDEPQKTDILWASVLNDFDVKEWQNKVHNNAEEFFNLCEHLKCYPDIFSLFFWSNWLTPPTYSTRFDTAFFLVGLEQKPTVIAEKTEVVEFMWSNPKDILQGHREGKIALMPPQIYELNRFSLISDLEQLLQYARTKSQQGNPCISTVIFAAKDGIVAVLPGDSLYPEDYNYLASNLYVRNDQTVAELRRDCSTLNRMEHSAGKSQFVVHNYPLIDGVDNALFDFSSEAWKLPS